MRFMTWNVWGRFGERWQRRQRAIVATLRAERPEFVALQETWRSEDQTQADLLAAELGMWSAFAPSRMPRDPDPDVRLGLAVMSRFPFRRVERHRLFEDTIALRAEVRMGNHNLHFVTTRLDWEDDHRRERQAEADALTDLVTELVSTGDGVVLAGDLNASPDRPVLRPLAADGPVSCESRIVGLDEDRGDPRSDHYAVVSDIPVATFI